MFTIYSVCEKGKTAIYEKEPNVCFVIQHFLSSLRKKRMARKSFSAFYWQEAQYWLSTTQVYGDWHWVGPV